MAGSSNSGEVFISISQAMRELGAKASPTTGMRWSTKGLAGLNGERIYLQTWACGRQIVTTKSAMFEFIGKVTAARVEKVQARSQGNGGDATFAELKAAGLVEQKRRNDRNVETKEVKE